MYLPIDIAEKTFYPIVAIVGVPVNLLGIAILCQGKCGLSTCTTRYLVAMATSDLLYIIFKPILNRINDYYFPLNFLDLTPVCRVSVVLMAAAMDCSVWFTLAFSFDRFVTIRSQKLKTKYCTGETAAVVLSTTGFLLCVKNIPWYFPYEPREIIDNVQWGCGEKSSIWTDPGWVVYNWFNQVLTPLIPFFSILLINALTVRHILLTSRVRKALRAQSQGDNRTDTEMESRKKSMILLFSISGTFILLWSVYVISFFYLDVSGLRDITLPQYSLQKVGLMLQDLSCCTNTFIYVVIQSRFREQIKLIVKYPITSIFKLMSK